MNVAYTLLRAYHETWISEPTRTTNRAFDERRTELRADTKAVTVDWTQRALLQTYQQCRIPDWDGHDARPVTAETLLMARRVLDVLPPGLPQPAFGAEPDGELTMEWYRSPRRLLSVSIRDDGDLNYAALIGTERVFGQVSFCGALPDTLATLIRKVHFK